MWWVNKKNFGFWEGNTRDALDEMKNLLNTRSLVKDKTDCWLWLSDNSGTFWIHGWKGGGASEGTSYGVEVVPLTGYRWRKIFCREIYNFHPIAQGVCSVMLLKNQCLNGWVMKFLQHPFYLVTKSEIFKWRVVWCSWNLWNQCIFNGGTFDKESLIQNILFTAWSWLNGLSAGFSYWFAQWCTCPGACIMRVIWRCIDNLEHVCVEWEYSKSYESE